MHNALTQREQNLSISRDEFIYQHLKLWETRGRGWGLYYYPVALEPPFCPFYHLLNIPEQPVTDDGKKSSFLSRLFEGDSSAEAAKTLSLYQTNLGEYAAALEESYKPDYCSYYGEVFTELQIILPKEEKLSKTAAENLLLSFSHLSHPVSFEIIATKEKIIIQFACTEKDTVQVRQQIKSHLPNYLLKDGEDYLNYCWSSRADSELIVDFGLSKEFCLPLKTSNTVDADFLVTAIGAVANLRDAEVGVLQVIFQKTRADWAEEIIDAVNYFDGTSPFSDNKNSAGLIKEKLNYPLFAVCLRVGAKSYHEDGAWRIVRNLGASLSHFSRPSGNELIPLSNDNYPEGYQQQALLDRVSFRPGMLLNTAELAALVHPPPDWIRSDKLLQISSSSKDAPDFVLGNPFILGENTHAGKSKQVTLSLSQRTRHIHLIGASGSGKSNLMLNLIKQDLDQGNGFCVIDPHGDLIDDVLTQIPENRINDVVLFDPADSEYPVGLNILKANSEVEKTLLASDLTATFRRFSTSWGDVMDSVLANAVLAFVESKQGGTLFDLKRFLVEAEFREKFLETVPDETIRYFWRNEFPLISGKPNSSILIRLDTFLRQKLIRNIVCQRKSTLDFREIMDHKKILLVKLSQGAIGEENSHLLGTLVVSKLHQIALSRQDTQVRPFFTLYMDEFQNFITPSMESILSGVRKYNIGLILAHQEFRQIQSRSSEVASSVLSNCYTRICFRLGDQDAEKFSSGFSFFDKADLQNLGIGEAIARVERSDYDFNLKTFLLPKIDLKKAVSRKEDIIKSSRTKYARARTEVIAEQKFSQEMEQTEPPPKTQETPSVVQSNFTSPPPKAVSKQIKQSNSNNVEGFGGEHHRAVQGVIKRMAENNGFSATIEKQVLDGAGKVDVSLENEKYKIAVEVCVTTNSKQELNNIQKCLKAQYDYVAVVVSNQNKIPNMQDQFKLELTPEQFEKVRVVSVTGFLEFLWKLTNYQPKRKNKSTGERLDITEASEFLGISPSTLYRWVNQGKVPFYRVGRNYQFDREELALIGRYDLSGKRKANVDLPPLEIKKQTPKTKKKQNQRYRKMLGLD